MSAKPPRPPAYTDVTVSFSKSISILHASSRENERRARQGTSRDGDPQDHIHNQIARITRTFSDGNWRALDTVSLRAILGALQAVAATTVERELTAEFGVDGSRAPTGAATRSAA